MQYIFIALIALLFVGWAIPAFVVIKEWERIPVLVLGRYWRTFGPGPVLIDWVICRKMRRVSLKDEVMRFKVQGQTLDKVALVLDFILTRNINDVKAYSLSVEDPEASLEDVARATARAAVGHYSLDQVQERTVFSLAILEAVKPLVKKWGFNVSAFSIDELKIEDTETAAAISAKARATARAAASITLAEAEVTVAEHLNKAAALLTPEGLVLRRIQTLMTLANSASNNTIIIPHEIANVLSAITSALPAPTGPTHNLPATVA